jgi:UDP-2,3-diacylglucosamine pyrophosphatase LpxH
MRKKKYHSVFISDTHLGMKGLDSTKLLDFLNSFDCENLFLVGDIIDGWCLKGSWYWPKINNEILICILKKANKGAKVHYIIGNHDEALKDYQEFFYDGITLTERLIYPALNGKDYLVIHGDIFDSVVQYAKWIAMIGNVAYEIIFHLTKYISRFRNMLGMKHWSLSQWTKGSVKSAVNFIGQYETVLLAEAKRSGVSGVICGHIHYPDMKTIKDVEYLNCGDFVETHSAIVEHLNGEFELLYFNENGKIKNDDKSRTIS